MIEFMTSRMKVEPYIARTRVEKSRCTRYPPVWGLPSKPKISFRVSQPQTPGHVDITIPQLLVGPEPTSGEVQPR